MTRIILNIFICVLTVLASSTVVNAKEMWPGTPVNITGVIDVPPCEIDDMDRIIVVDFGTIIDKYLYLNTRTHGEQFKIHLHKCSSAKDLVITFKGNESSELPGLIAFGGGSQASGAAIGLELPDGTPITLNKPSPEIKLTSGDNTIVINAYVQGEPGPMASHTIERGLFNASATFYLDYP